MLYIVQDIKPLNIDLIALPISEGSRNLYATAVDGTQIGIRLSSGYLEVRSSPEDETNDYFAMKKILFSKKIFPYYLDDPDPAVFCELLGLTVQGERVQSPLIQNGYDLSRKTSYWYSEHLTRFYDDASQFIDIIMKKLPNARLFQHQLDTDGITMRWREVTFFMNQDESIVVVVGNKNNDLQDKLNKGEKLQSLAPFTFRFYRSSFMNSRDASGRDIIERFAPKNKKLDYQILRVLKYTLSAQFDTDDSYSQSQMREIICTINSYFKNNSKAVNLENGNLLCEEILSAFQAYKPSYSKKLEGWCLEKNNRYIQVGHTRFNDEAIFYGWRP